MRSLLSWYVGCLAAAWGLTLTALIAILASPVWAGNNCQPAPQPASEQIAEVGMVAAFVAAFGAGFVAMNDRTEAASSARRAFFVLMTLAACAVLLVLEIHHAPSCPTV